MTDWYCVQCGKALTMDAREYPIEETLPVLGGPNRYRRIDACSWDCAQAWSDAHPWPAEPDTSTACSRCGAPGAVYGGHLRLTGGASKNSTDWTLCSGCFVITRDQLTVLLAHLPARVDLLVTG